METTFSAARAFKKAFTQMVMSLVDLEQVKVVDGRPGQDALAWDDIVAMSHIEAVQDVAGFGSTRPREETIILTVTISCWRQGGPEAQDEAQDQAYRLLALIEEHVRTVDTTVAGTVRQCFMTRHESAGASVQGEISGSVFEVEAMFEAKHRIRG